MKISTISARGISGLSDIDVDLMGGGSAAPHSLFLVSGPGASGKTRLLEAIVATFEAVAPYEGMVRALDWVANPNVPARIELGLWLDATERSSGGTTPIAVRFESGRVSTDAAAGLSKQLQRYDHEESTPKREYFPETRQLWWGAQADGLGALEQSLLRGSKQPSKYSFVPRFLASLVNDPVRSERFGAAIRRLAPGLEYLPGQRERCFSSHGDAPVAPTNLSSSEADAVLICATAMMIGLNHSLVLLDRPELYVPPNHIVAFVQALATLGTNNQWIVATNSFELIQSVTPGQIAWLGSDVRDRGRAS